MCPVLKAPMSLHLLRVKCNECLHITHNRLCVQWGMGCLAALFAFGLWSWRVRAQGARRQGGVQWRGVAAARVRTRPRGRQWADSPTGG